jgi:hypothetical protein
MGSRRPQWWRRQRELEAVAVVQLPQAVEEAELVAVLLPLVEADEAELLLRPQHLQKIGKQFITCPEAVRR